MNRDDKQSAPKPLSETRDDNLVKGDIYEELMDEHQIVMYALSKARKAFDGVIESYDMDPAYFQLSLLVDFLDGELSGILETVGWPSEVRDVRLVKKEREGE